VRGLSTFSMREMVSLCVDAETCDLGEVRRGGEVKYVYFVKDVVSVEPAKNEQS